MADLPLIFLSVDLCFQLINRGFRRVKHSCNLLDPQLARLGGVSLVNDPLFDCVPLLREFEFNEGGLLIKEVALCFLCFGWLTILLTVGKIGMASSCIFDLLCDFFPSSAEFFAALFGSLAFLLLLQLLESLGVSFNLPPNRLHILLGASVLESDVGEDLAHSPE